MASLAFVWLAVRDSTRHGAASPSSGQMASRTSSIADLIEVPIGGHQQAMMIPRQDVNNPVLLYLAGGPGGTDLGAMR